MTYYKCGRIYTTQNSNVVVDTASGAIANFQTPLALPLLKTSFDINAKQDLHGYDHPWPAGGGKNLLKTSGLSLVPPSSTLFSNATKRTFASNSFCLGLTSNNYFQNNKVTQYLVEENNISITSSANAYAVIIPITNLNIGETYTLSASSSQGKMSVGFWEENGTFISNTQEVTINVLSFTVPQNAFYVGLSFNPRSNDVQATFTNIQLEKGSTATEYAPYENICPISGWSEVQIANCGNTELTPFLRGLLQGKYGFVEMNNLNWMSSTYTDVNYFVTTLSLPNVKAPKSSGRTANAICNGYENMPSNGVTSPVFVSGTMFIWTTGRLFLKDENYTDVSSFVSSLQGKYLIYELATPVIPTITEEQINIICEAFNANNTFVKINLGGTYYGGYVTQDKDGKRKFEVTFRSFVIDSSLTGAMWYETYKQIYFQDALSDYPAILYRYNTTAKCDKLLSLGLDERYNHIGNYITAIKSGNGVGMSISGCDTLEQAEEFIQNNPILFVYKLATPYTIDLPDGTPIKSLPGVNNIFADTGDTSLQFRKIG